MGELSEYFYAHVIVAPSIHLLIYPLTESFTSDESHPYAYDRRYDSF